MTALIQSTVGFILIYQTKIYIKKEKRKIFKIGCHLSDRAPFTMNHQSHPMAKNEKVSIFSQTQNGSLFSFDSSNPEVSQHLTNRKDFSNSWSTHKKRRYMYQLYTRILWHVYKLYREILKRRADEWGLSSQYVIPFSTCFNCS